MNSNNDSYRLAQTKMLESLQRELQLTEMVTLYLSDTDDYENHIHFIYCALIPSDQAEETLSRLSWDLYHGNGIPSAVIYHNDGEKQVEYLRYGNDYGIEPLVIDRDFHGVRDNYKEICEEFRLFHELYHDKKQDKYIKISDDGNEHLVAIIEPNRVQIRLKEIRQFLAIKEMHLSIQFDFREHSEYSLEELGLTEGGSDQRKGLIYWGHYYGDLDGISNHRAFSRLSGKRLIGPLPKSKSGFCGFAEEPKKKHVDFTIGTDENGEEIAYTSNPDALANFFGANPDAPNYLTPVHFRREVLDRYYQQPSKYSVDDSMLRCGELWSMHIDNHHDDTVCAWLGDLGRDLSYEEQLHWRAHNLPLKMIVSKIYFKREILAEFADSDRPEHLFKEHYHALNIACREYLGWQLLLELNAGDEHHIQCIRIPATDEQREFDNLILSITKILIDSLNEKNLKQMIPMEQRAGLQGSISIFEAATNACGIEDSVNQISFLRQLQRLRSSSAAHRKSSNYRKIANEFGADNKDLKSVFSSILWQALAFLDFLIAAVRSGQFKTQEDLASRS